MFSNVHTNTDPASTDLAITAPSSRMRRGVGAVLAVGAVALSACGTETAEVASLPPVPVQWATPAGPVPTPWPQYELRPNVPDPVAGAVTSSFEVEFGGMPAPAGEPNWAAVPVVVPPVEFGGMAAPAGEPNWAALPVPAPPVEFGGMPAPVGNPRLPWFDGGTDPGPTGGPR